MDQKKRNNMESKKFEITFAKIYPDFTKNLVCLKGNLSPSEIKICMCIKMSYSNIQIKEYMKISDSTIANLRSSVRHKLGLERSQSLTNVILVI
jgi:DNA-binding CsgD family transcriptional regulator